MSTIEVNKITPVSGGTTVQVGESGDTINIPSGATIANAGTATGFADADDYFATSGLSAKDLGSGLHIKTGDCGGGTIAAGRDELVIEGSGSTGMTIVGGTGNDIGIGFGDSDNTNIGLINYNNTSNYMTLQTNNSERMRILSNGKVGINKTAPSGMFVVINSHNDEYMAQFNNSHGENGQYGLQVKFDNARDNNSQHAIHFQDSTTTRFKVWADGDVVNHDNSYGSTSDERIKQDIRDSNSQWNDIKAVKVRNFKKKDDVRQYGENAWEQIGVVAQELETVSPKLIKNCEPTEGDILSDSSFGTLYQEGDEIPEGKNIGDIKEIKEKVKKVSYSVLYMKSIKALQEAMDRIETLEAKVTALENA